MSRSEEFLHVMRGIAVQNLSDEDQARIDRLSQMPMEDHEVDQHLGIGPILLDHLQNNFVVQDRQQGLGTHWTTKRSIAEIAAGTRMGGQHRPVIVHAEVDPAHTVPSQGFHDEDETTIPTGAPVRVTGVETPLFGRMEHVLQGIREARA